MLRRLILPLVALCLLQPAAARIADAAEILVEGSRMIVSGRLFGQRELADLTNQIAKNSSITTIVFKDFHISNAGTHPIVAFAKFIRSKGLSTEVNGRCSPACGLAFMGGVRRSVAQDADPNKTYVSLRGSYRITGATDESYRATYVALLQYLSGGKMPTSIARLAYSLPIDSFMLFFDGRRVKNKAGVSAAVCQDVRTRGLRDCKGIADVDSHAVGVFTD